MSEPRLSLCIPTFNRATLLRELLENISRELQPPDETVEVVVSDNCSSDDTPNVVAEYQSRMKISYYLQQKNIGIAANISLVPSLATGRFCWMLGDDDLLVPGSIRQLLDLLEEYPTAPAIVVGYSYQQQCNRANYTPAHATIAFERPIFQCDHDPKWVPRWEDIFFATTTPALQTSIVSCVFRRQQWLQHAPDIESLARVEALTSLETTFPHAMTWASFLAGKPVVFAPRPYVYFFVGAQEWLKPKWLTIVFSYCLELAQDFRRQGANEQAVHYYESLLLGHPGIANLIVAPNEYAKEHFSLFWLINHYGKRKELWASLAASAQSISCRCVPALARRCMVPCWRCLSGRAICTKAIAGILWRSVRKCLASTLKRGMKSMS